MQDSDLAFIDSRRSPSVSPINQERTLAQQLSGAFVVLGVLVGAAFLVTAAAYGIGWAWLTPELERSRQAERAESASQAAMIDEESGLRGYLMTRDARFLEPYILGDSKLRQANDALTAGAGSNAELTTAMVSTAFGRATLERGLGQSRGRCTRRCCVPVDGGGQEAVRCVPA